MKEHLFEYGHAGATWGVTMHADSPAEAREKLRAASLGAYKGEVQMRIPLGISLTRLFNWALRH